MASTIILTEGEEVTVASNAVDWTFQEPLELDPEEKFTVVSYEGTYGRKTPVRVIISDSKGSEYEVASDFLAN